MTAALVGAARLGAPLSDDFAVVSLSDLHVEWETIERRLDALAASGIALCLYNPRSRDADVAARARARAAARATAATTPRWGSSPTPPASASA